MKHSISASKDIMNELTLIVKYFYLFVLSKRQKAKGKRSMNVLAFVSVQVWIVENKKQRQKRF